MPMVEIFGKTADELKESIKSDYPSARVVKYTVSFSDLPVHKIDLTPLDFEYLHYITTPDALKGLERTIQFLSPPLHENSFAKAAVSLSQKLYGINLRLEDRNLMTLYYVLLKKVAIEGEFSAVLDEEIHFWGC